MWILYCNNSEEIKLNETQNLYYVKFKSRRIYMAFLAEWSRR